MPPAGEAFACFQETMADAVELKTPGDVLAAAAGPLRSPGSRLALALAANRIERGINAAD